MLEPDPPTSDITRLLQRWSDGDRHALEELMPLVYDQLRKLAGAHVRREGPGDTLQATGLVHEAYLRLTQQRQVSFENRLRFFGAAAQIMRRVLCDRARQRRAQKRGSGLVQQLDEWDVAAVAVEDQPVALDLLDTALEELEQLDARKVRIIELRYFAGLSIAECAESMGLSPATVKREWTVARAWLANRLRGEP
jgi:RNA polymerase sigma factor (TIGR02999 family)